MSQALLNTVVRVLARVGESAYVETPDTYRGWVAAEALGPLPPEEGEPHLVARTVGPAYATPRAHSPHMQVYYGTRFGVVGREGTLLQVRLPDGFAWLPAALLRREEFALEWAEPACAAAPRPTAALPPLDMESLLADALQWVGTPYLWGGGTPAGVDCSGFVQALFRAHGRLLLRDARLQVRQGTPVPLPAIQRGDLLFFGRSQWNLPTHVGIVLGPDTYIHARGGDVRRVVISPLQSALETAWGARRVR